MSAVAAVTLQFIVEACIRVGSKVHAACAEQEAVVRVGCDIVKQLGGCFVSVVGCGCLFGANGTKTDQELVVHSACVLE